MITRKTQMAIGTIAATAATASIALSGVASAGSTVTLKDDKFAPTSITVAKGTKVTFVWKGKNLHNVAGSGAATFKSKFQSSGTFAYTFKKKGVVKLVCQVHPGMKATLKVK